jgi:hypothetical protein
MEKQVIVFMDEPRGPSQLIEIPVTAGSQRITIPDQQQLRSTVDTKVILKAVRLITLATLSDGIITNLPNAPVADLQKMALVIKAEGWEKGQYIPVLTLNDVNDNGTNPNRYNTTRFNNWQNVDWNQSYLQYANGESASGNFVVIFEAEYIKLNAQGRVLEGPQ